jgi:superfamily II DNA helicase RecQ
MPSVCPIVSFIVRRSASTILCSNRELTAYPVRTIVVDEAHCVSQWGTRFPALNIVRSLPCVTNAPRAAWGAFTATATQNVLKDIEEQLKLNAAGVFEFPMQRGKSHLFRIYFW